jgi:hypothetical protein
MASKSKRVASPLQFMERLSNNVYFYDPGTSSQPDPKLIIIFGWTAASDKHLAVYAQKYRDLFPTSAIVLFKASVASLTYPKLIRNDVFSIVALLRKKTSRSDSNQPQLLLHLFSNGGSAMQSILYSVYAETGPENDRTLPPHVTIMDSAPAASWEYNKIIAALSPGIPRGLIGRIVGIPLCHLLALWKMGSIRLLRFPDDLAVWSQSHNDKLNTAELRRVYCYGDKDPVVPFIDVEKHATAAEERGFAVRKEFFKGSSHVAHMRSDPDRYWKIVKDVWSPEKARL